MHLDITSYNEVQLAEENPTLILAILDEVYAKKLTSEFRYLWFIVLIKHKYEETSKLVYLKIAAKAYEILLQKEDSFLLFDSLMLIRLRAIEDFGKSSIQDELLNRNVFLEWVNTYATDSIEVIQEQAAHWTKQDIEIIRKLKYLKITISRLNYLIEIEALPLTQEINQWISLYKILP